MGAPNPAVCRKMTSANPGSDLNRIAPRKMNHALIANPSISPTMNVELKVCRLPSDYGLLAARGSQPLRVDTGKDLRTEVNGTTVSAHFGLTVTTTGAIMEGEEAR